MSEKKPPGPNDVFGTIDVRLFGDGRSRTDTTDSAEMLHTLRDALQVTKAALDRMVVPSPALPAASADRPPNDPLPGRAEPDFDPALQAIANRIARKQEAERKPATKRGVAKIIANDPASNPKGLKAGAIERRTRKEW